MFESENRTQNLINHSIGIWDNLNFTLWNALYIGLPKYRLIFNIGIGINIGTKIQFRN